MSNTNSLYSYYFAIEALTKKHGAAIIEYFKSLGFQTDFKGGVNKEDGGENRFYFVRSGSVNTTNSTGISRMNIPIISLPDEYLNSLTQKNFSNNKNNTQNEEKRTSTERQSKPEGRTIRLEIGKRPNAIKGRYFGNKTRVKREEAKIINSKVSGRICTY